MRGAAVLLVLVFHAMPVAGQQPGLGPPPSLEDEDEATRAQGTGGPPAAPPQDGPRSPALALLLAVVAAGALALFSRRE